MSGGMVGGGGVPEDLLDTKGQVHGFSTVNSAISVGSDDQQMYADSTNADGISYGASPKSLMGTTGDILSASSANTLSVISPSTSGDVLMSNGAGVVPSFQTAGGGGATEFVGLFTQTSTTEQHFSTGTLTSIDLTAYDVLGTVTATSTSNRRINFALNGGTDFRYLSCFINNTGSFSALYDHDSSDGSAPMTGRVNVPADFTCAFHLTDSGNTVRSPMYFQTWLTNSVNIFGIAWLDGSMHTFDELDVRNTDGTSLYDYLQNCQICLWKRKRS